MFVEVALFNKKQTCRLWKCLVHGSGCGMSGKTKACQIFVSSQFLTLHAEATGVFVSTKADFS